MKHRKPIPKPPKDDYWKLGLAHVGMSSRTANALKKVGIVDLQQIIDLGTDIRRVPGLGKKCVQELAEEIERLHPYLVGWPDNPKHRAFA
jgi:DNA-directed RNA polymerase alpha subunit